MTAGTTAPNRWGPGAPLASWVFQLAFTAVWVSVLVALFFGGEYPDPAPIWLVGASALAIWAVYLAAPILITRMRGEGPVAELWSTATWRDWPIGLAIGVFLQLAVLPALYWPILQLTETDPGETAQDLVDRVDGPLDTIILSFVVAVGAPLAEEFFYRGFLLQGLRRRLPDVGAVLISSALFALVHIQPIIYPGTFLLGVVAAIATLRTRRLGLAWAMHVGFNGATLVLLLLQTQ